MISFIVIFLANVLALFIVFFAVTLGGKYFVNLFKQIKNRRQPGQPFIKYLVDLYTPIKVGDLVKTNLILYNTSDVMVVLETNVFGPESYPEKIGPGFIVLANNKKLFISKNDCYLVKVSN